MTTLIDLFAGMGGFTSGFNKQGYECRGYDINPYTSEIFQINRIGEGFTRDLSKLTVNDYADVVTGGPPCKPWSCLNLRRRCEFNANYGLVDVFFKTVSTIKPAAFIMENVPPVAKSHNLLVWVRKMRRRGYSLSMSTIIYSDYEAAISRKRFILVGTRDKNNSKLFFEKLNEIIYTFLQNGKEAKKELMEWFLNDIMNEEAKMQVSAFPYERIDTGKAHRNGTLRAAGRIKLKKATDHGIFI